MITTPIARVSHFYGGVKNFLLTLPGCLGVPEILDTQCRHCMTGGYRRASYLLEEEGELIQIGDACLADYLRNKLQADRVILKFRELNPFDIPVLDALEITRWIVNDRGWVSDKEVRDTGKIPTSETVKSYWTGGLFLNVIPFSETIELLRWCREELVPDDDYSANVASALYLDYIPIEYLPLVCNAHRVKLAFDRETKVILDNLSSYVGTEKERITGELTLVKILGPFPGQYGELWGYKFTQGNNDLLWWTTSVLEDGEIGKAYEYKFTIKSHEEYRGIKQTIITRVVRCNSN